MMKVLRFLDKIIGYMGYVGAGIGVAAIAFMMLMITGNVLLRYLFNKPQLFVEELAAYALVAAVFLGLA